MNGNTIASLIALGFALLAVFSGYRWGMHDAELTAIKSRQIDVAHAIDQANALNSEDADILRASEAIRTITRTRTVYRTQEAARHVAKNPDLYGQRLDACGLCLARSAANDTDPATCSCQLDDAVPDVIRAGGNGG